MKDQKDRHAELAEASLLLQLASKISILLMEAGHSLMSETPLLSFTELQHAADCWQGSEQKDFRGAVNLLLSAVTDWPSFDLKEPIDLVASLHAEICGPLTFNSLHGYAATIDDPWKKEAVDALLELFGSYQKQHTDFPTELETVLLELTRQYRMLAHSTKR